MTERKLDEVLEELEADPSVELSSSPQHEITQVGRPAPPARGSTALPRRPPFLQPKPPDIAASNSDARRARTEARRHVDEQESRPPVTRPPPTDDAGTPESASAARAEAKRAVAEIGRVDAETAREVRRLYGVDPGTRKWIIAILGMMGATAGTALYGAVRDPVPEKVKQAPVVVTDQQRDIDRVREDLGQCRSDVRDLERDLKRTNRNVESLTGKVNELIERTPRIEGVKP